MGESLDDLNDVGTTLGTRKMSLWQTTRDTGVTFTEVEADVFPVRSTSARGSPRSSERAKQFTQFTQRVKLTERVGGGSFGVGVEVDFVQGGAERGVVPSSLSREWASVWLPASRQRARLCKSS